MNAPNIKPSDRVAILAAIDPDAASAGAVNSAWIDVTNWQNLMAIVMAGDLGASATLNAKLEQATSAAGAGAKDVTGKAIAQLTQAGAGSDKQAIINCSQYDLDFNNGFKFVRLSMTVATAASEIAGLLLGFDPRYNVASDNDAAAVAEIVG
jgi:hypothetical protein